MRPYVPEWPGWGRGQGLADEASLVGLAGDRVQAAHPVEHLLAVAAALPGHARDDQRAGERGARVSIAHVGAVGHVDDPAHVEAGGRADGDAARRPPGPAPTV